MVARGHEVAIEQGAGSGSSISDEEYSLLAPMPEVAGRIAPQVGAATLLRSAGGRGVLLGGVPGVLPANVVIIGGGVSGQHATRIAAGMGAQVTVPDKNPHALKAIDKEYHGHVRTLASSAFAVEQECLDSVEVASLL